VTTVIQWTIFVAWYCLCCLDKILGQCSDLLTFTFMTFKSYFKYKGPSEGRLTHHTHWLAEMICKDKIYCEKMMTMLLWLKIIIWSILIQLKSTWFGLNFMSETLNIAVKTATSTCKSDKKYSGCTWWYIRTINSMTRLIFPHFRPAKSQPEGNEFRIIYCCSLHNLK
jgi:hypothetical protein